MVQSIEYASIIHWSSEQRENVGKERDYDCLYNILLMEAVQYDYGYEREYDCVYNTLLIKAVQ